MTDMNRYWDTWSPYWSYFENNFLDIEGINKLAIDIVDPVLVVGAGQGLLVEQLHQKGFKADGVDLSAQMVKYAKQRRNIDLIQADAKNLPLPDGCYKTCIVATGVVDFTDDEEQIASILDEAQRVTDGSGKTLVAFCRFPPRAEKFMKSMGMFTEDGYLRNKRMCQYTNMRPGEFLAALRKDLNVSLLHVLCLLVKGQILLPKKARQASKSWATLWKKVRAERGGTEAVMEVVPDLVPYRGEAEIRSLFERLRKPVHQVYPYDSCTVVLLGPKAR